jgi:hypothetical protein
LSYFSLGWALVDKVQVGRCTSFPMSLCVATGVLKDMADSITFEEGSVVVVWSRGSNFDQALFFGERFD